MYFSVLAWSLSFCRIDKQWIPRRDNVEFRKSRRGHKDPGMVPGPISRREIKRKKNECYKPDVRRITVTKQKLFFSYDRTSVNLSYSRNSFYNDNNINLDSKKMCLRPNPLAIQT